MKKFLLLFTLLTLLSAIGGLQTTFAQPVTQEWVARYNSTYNLTDISAGIVVDKSGNSYVTGYSFVTGVQNTVATTVKYNSLGVLQWVRIYYDAAQPENESVGIAIDTSSNIFITGYSGNVNTSYAYTWLVKYNTYGDSLWSRKYYALGQTNDPYAIITDKSGNVYITGNQAPPSFTIKYNTNGDTLWSRTYEEPGYQYTQFTSIALDTLGNVYVGGAAHVVIFVRDYLVLKYNRDGVKQWSKTYGVYNKDEIAHKIAVDRFSNVYITGTGYNPNTADPYDYITIKYNSTGVQQWVKTYSRNVDEAFNLVVDYSDNIIVTGESSILGNGPNYCTIKYTPTGDTQWVRIYVDTSTNPYDIAYSITVDSSNNIYISGRGGTNGPTTTIKYSYNGVQLWKMNYPIQLSTNGNSIAIDRARNIFVTGSDGDFVTIKYSQLDAIKKISTVVPDNFYLSQNYPNPFNPSTKIKFDIPDFPLVKGARGMSVRLSIYDLLGREITTLVNQQLKPGTYEVEFDGTDYPSGVYLYRLSAGDLSETKKLVLLK
ncbi:MAG: SBBP repeat-containing protein [Ignavibacteria bacterium]